MQKNYKKVRITDITPYNNNPRINDSAVDDVVKSIKQCGYISPIIVDENLVVLAGHTRLKALERLHEEKIEVIVVSGLTEEQKRKYRLLDNKLGEEADWDFDLLADELDGLDFGDLDLDWGMEEDYADEYDEEEPADESENYKDEFTLNLAFPIEKKADINALISDRGKGYLTDLIIREAESLA